MQVRGRLKRLCASQREVKTPLCKTEGGIERLYVEGGTFKSCFRDIGKVLNSYVYLLIVYLKYLHLCELQYILLLDSPIQDLDK